MRGFVANTDYQWYEFLSARPDASARRDPLMGPVAPGL
jgi:hypothetical protein